MKRTEYTIASGLFRPPLDFILHNAGYVYVGHIADVWADEDRRESLLSLPGIGKRHRQAIEMAMQEPGLVVEKEARVW